MSLPFSYSTFRSKTMWSQKHWDKNGGNISGGKVLTRWNFWKGSHVVFDDTIVGWPFSTTTKLFQSPWKFGEQKRVQASSVGCLWHFFKYHPVLSPHPSVDVVNSAIILGTCSLQQQIQVSQYKWGNVWWEICWQTQLLCHFSLWVASWYIIQCYVSLRLELI